MNRPAVLVAVRGRVIGIYPDTVRYHQIGDGPFVVTFQTPAGEALVGTIVKPTGEPLRGEEAERYGFAFMAELIRAAGAATGGAWGVFAKCSNLAVTEPQDGPTTALIAVEHFGGAGATPETLAAMVGRVLVEVHPEGGNMVSLLFQ